MLREGLLDVALTSSVHFLDHRSDYVLLSDLGIAATERAISTKLFFNDETLQLDQRSVYVPATSASTTRLLRVLCSAFWHVTPTFVPTDLSVEQLRQQKDPFMLFGDAPLKHHSLHTILPSIDLCEAWNKVTKKGFIFAVLATRNDALKNNSWEIVDFHRKVEESFLWSEGNKHSIISEAAKRLGCQESFLSNYFNCIEYRLTPRHFHGFHHFATLEEAHKAHAPEQALSII